MTDQRFIKDGTYVKDSEGIISPIKTQNYGELCETLDELNDLSNENKSLKEQKRVLQKEWKNILPALEELGELRKEKEHLKKALLWYMDIATCETSSSFDKDMEELCQLFFNCSYQEAKPMYEDINTFDDLASLFQKE